MKPELRRVKPDRSAKRTENLPALTQHRAATNGLRKEVRLGGGCCHSSAAAATEFPIRLIEEAALSAWNGQCAPALGTELTV